MRQARAYNVNYVFNRLYLQTITVTTFTIFNALNTLTTSVSVTGLRNMDAQFRELISLETSNSGLSLLKLTKYSLNRFANAWPVTSLPL